MEFIKKNAKGILFSLVIAIPSFFLGKLFPIVGGPVFAIIIGMIVTLFVKDKTAFEVGIKFTSKKFCNGLLFCLDLGLIWL